MEVRVLILRRRPDESIVIDLRAFGLGLIELLVVDCHNNSPRLGIEAAKGIPVHRAEVFEAIERERGEAAA